MMERLGACADHSGETEEFGLDCHDISLENVFVDENNPTEIVSFIYLHVFPVLISDPE
jgi:hypothetical protein